MYFLKVLRIVVCLSNDIHDSKWRIGGSRIKSDLLGENYLKTTTKALKQKSQSSK